MKADILDYLPDPSEVTADQMLAVRERLVAYCKTWWEELDTRPGSVFGDTHITPLATIIASLEEAQRRMAADTDLSSIANGEVYNLDAVQSYLAQFTSRTSQKEIPASGLLKLTFSADANITLADGLEFEVGGHKVRLVQTGSDVYSIYDSRSTHPGPRLYKDGLNFSVFVPVIADNAVEVDAGIEATTDEDLSDVGFVSAVTAAAFDAGLAAVSVSETAKRLQVGFTASGYTTLAGIKSLILSQVPELSHVYPVRTGDAAMRRQTTLALGPGMPMVDLYVRSPELAETVLDVTLTYSPVNGRWQGRMPDGLMPVYVDPYHAAGTAASPDNNRGAISVIGRARPADVNAWLLGNSSKAEYGLLWTDASPENFQQSELQPAVQTYGTVQVSMSVSGEYEGSPFQGGDSRDLLLRIQTVDATYVTASVVDQNQGIHGTVRFLRAASGGFNIASVENALDYGDFLAGLTVSLSATEDPSSWIGNTYRLQFRGRTAEFQVRVLHDPGARRVVDLVASREYGPAGAVDVLPKTYFHCSITTLQIRMQVPHGTTFDSAGFKQAIIDYATSLSGQFDDGVVKATAVAMGASLVDAVEVQASYKLAFADTWQEAGAAEATALGSLVVDGTEIPANNVGLTKDNVMFTLEADAIELIRHG